MKKIHVSDITLRELSNAREVSLLFREKTAIATAAAALGADAVELPAIGNIREDSIIYKTIAQSVHDAVVAIEVGASEDGVKAAWECVKDAEKARLQVALPVATATMEYAYHIKAANMGAKISALVSKAREFCDDVEFVALDATRADKDFLCSCVEAAVAAGAGIVTLCDSVGCALPEEMASLVETVKAKISVPVFVEVSDEIGMAVAVAVAATTAGAEGVKCALSGNKTLITGKFSDAIYKRGEALGVCVSLKNTQVHTSTEELLKKITSDVSYGDVSSDASKSSILISSESTLAEVASAAKILGYDLTDEDCGNVYNALRQVFDKKDSVGARELEALIASYAMQAPSKYHLESYTTNCGNLASSMSQVTLRVNDELLCGVSTGDGPIDSVFRAIEQCIGYHYELDDFQIHAVTEGKEALGSALVRLRSRGKLYSGNGISTDIVAASVRAYINALNKIVFEEN